MDNERDLLGVLCPGCGECRLLEYDGALCRWSCAVCSRMWPFGPAGLAQGRTPVLERVQCFSRGPHDGRAEDAHAADSEFQLMPQHVRPDLAYGGERVSKRADRPNSDWLRVSAPELQIVSDDLWTRAHSRFAERQRKHGGGAGRRSDIESAYLLSGFARCGSCGGGLCAHSRQHGGHRLFFYGCTSFWKRGAKVCANNLVGRMDKYEEVLAMLQDDVCRPAVIAEAIRQALEELSPARQEADRGRPQAELETIRQECDRLAEAIGRGGPMDACCRVSRNARRNARHSKLG